MNEFFRAVVLDQVDGRTEASVKELPETWLRAGAVTVDVSHSTLNYKDALAITGKGKIVRDFPFVPGIDLAGTVRSSESPAYRAGEPVLLTGWGVGEKSWGGLSTLARVEPEWLLPLPGGLSPRRAMAIGTAGFTSMLAVMALEEAGVQPGDGPVLVTGAAGGVGSVALALLKRRGYHAAASTGRPELETYLKGLGAAEVVERGSLTETTRAPLDSQRWAAAIDTVGGTTLANILKSMKYRGVVAACGLAGGSDLPTTVFPFILRGVRLVGVDSVYAPEGLRRRAWARLVEDLDMATLDAMTRVVSLDEVPSIAPDFLKGAVKGRIVVETVGHR